MNSVAWKSRLDGGPTGTVQVSGTLDASSRTPGQSAGTIKVLAGLQNGAVNLSGALDASAPQGGHGGFIETSAAHVKIADRATITTAAPGGLTGTWLIDPHDFVIASTGGDITGSTLSSSLAKNNVTIESSLGGGGTKGDIDVNDAVAWNANTLTLTAAHDININAVMTATGSASLAMNPTTKNGGDAAVAGGAINMKLTGAGFTGRVDFSSTGMFSIDGTPYTVINSLGIPGDTSGATLQGINGNLAGHYVLGSNINAKATSGWNNGKGFQPIGSYNYATSTGTPFTGVFDGFGHTITGLFIRSSLNVGLFGGLTGATVQNVGLVNDSVTNGSTTLDGSSAGGLVGYNGGTVSNAYATGSVSGGTNSTAGDPFDGSSTGGLVGYNLGTISNAYTTGSVSGGANSSDGGLVGYNFGGTISDAYATGSVGGGTNAGGLVGAMYGGTISDAYATGSVSGGSAGGLVGTVWTSDDSLMGGIDNAYATGNVSGGTYSNDGGLVGYNRDDIISNAYATGNVSGGGGSSIGGLVGGNLGTVSNAYATGSVSGGTDSFDGGLVGYNYNSPISNAYATGNVSGGGGSLIGGLVGANLGPISNAYATGSVSGGSGSSAGGLVGYNVGTVSNSYWNTQTSEQSVGIGDTINLTSEQSVGIGGINLTGATGLTTAQLKAKLPSGFKPAIWTIDPSTNNGYPSLKWQATSTPTATITWSVANTFGTYGGSLSLGSVTLNGVPTNDTNSVFGALGLFSGTNQVALNTILPVGTYTEKVIDLSGSAAGKYTLATSGNVAGTLQIQPKPLTWSVADATSTYGSPPQLGAAQLFGVVGTGSPNAIVSTFTGAAPVSLTSNTAPGSYAEKVTSLTGLVAANYALASTGNSPGTLTISPIPTPSSGSGSVTSVGQIGPSVIGKLTRIQLQMFRSSAIPNLPSYPSFNISDLTPRVLAHNISDLTPRVLAQAAARMGPSYFPLAGVPIPNPSVAPKNIITFLPPQVATDLGNGVAKSAFVAALKLALQSSGLPKREVISWAKTYLKEAFKNATGKVSKGATLSILYGFAGNLAYYIAEKNGASPSLADFDKNLAELVSEGIIQGPAAEAISAVTEIAESGTLLMVSDVNNFNFSIAQANATAATVDRLLLKLKNQHSKRAIQLDGIAEKVRWHIVKIRQNHPFISVVSEIPGTSMSIIRHIRWGTSQILLNLRGKGAATLSPVL